MTHEKEERSEERGSQEKDGEGGRSLGQAGAAPDQVGQGESGRAAGRERCSAWAAVAEAGGAASYGGLPWPWPCLCRAGGGMPSGCQGGRPGCWRCSVHSQGLRLTLRTAEASASVLRRLLSGAEDRGLGASRGGQGVWQGQGASKQGRGEP